MPTTPQARWQIQACVAMTRRSTQFDHGLTYAWRKPMRGGAATPLLGRATPSLTAVKTTRPRGGAITEWYKGKTLLPVWRQISVEICRSLDSPCRLELVSLTVAQAGFQMTHRSRAWLARDSLPTERPRLGSESPVGYALRHSA